MTTLRKALRRAFFDDPGRRRLLTRIKRWAGDEGARWDDLALTAMARALRPNSNCVDVGCHDGLYLDEMLRLAPAGEHHAFEPIPALVEGLRRRYRGRGQIHVHEVALADAVGVNDFHLNRTRPSWSGLRRRTYPRADDVVEVVRVATGTLDEVLPRDARVDLVKIDVEGAELAVLRGARGVLRQCRPTLIFEYGLGAAEYYEAWPETVFDLLSEAGLRVWPVERCEEGEVALGRGPFAAHFRERRGCYFLARP